MDHVGITEKTFARWLELQEKMKQAGFNQYYTHNETTIDAYDKAVEDVIQFEQQVGVTEENFKKIGM